jgi:hypothetical protein
MLGIDNYSPAFHENIEAFIAAHGCNLRSLIGQKIEKTWAMWSRVDDAWFSDGPVILLVNRRQIELAAFQFGFALTFDAIDRGKPLRWCVEVDEAADGLGLFWKEHASHPLEDPVGKTITAIDLFESRVKVGDAEWWNFDGVGFQLDNGGYLAIYNKLDELGVADVPQVGMDVRATPL